MKPAIKAENVGKSYKISHQTDLKPSYGTLKNDLANIIKRPLGFGASQEEENETFWALKDVSFEINQGDAFGVVGRNGSGKSTLLKILSRIADPTTGLIHMHGKVASMLEVGTGFNPELTGRENIFFNGSMIGMSRQEIRRKFNDIVGFSEVEQFLDTPVKFYSSGMYVRLAFSVAAHLEPDILILDEVLSVGDAQFQKKSLNKMLDVIKEGRTIIFVSHSMVSVKKICQKGILLSKGRLVMSGDIEDVAERYETMMASESDSDLVKTVWQDDGKVKNDYFRLNKIHIALADGKATQGPVPSDKDCFVVIDAEMLQENNLISIGYAIYNENRNLMYFSMTTDIPEKDWTDLKKGKIRLIGQVPAHLLNSGTYRVSIVGGIHNKFWLFDPDENNNPSVQLQVKGGLSDSPRWKNPRSGFLAPKIDWKVEIKS